MKRGSWKKVAALSLAAVMCLGLAACDGGGNGDQQGGQIGTGGNNVVGGGQSGQAGKENVYSYQELNVLDRHDNVLDMCYLDGKLYLLTDRYGGSGEEIEGGNAFGFYRANADGSDCSFVKLAFPEREETGSWINSSMISDAGSVFAVVGSSY